MPGRLLRLLALLQSRREWSGTELAERLGITTRTLRRDVERLRALDYPVHSTTGTAGGYRLGAGRNLPPLLLDDEEAVAVAVALATAAGGNVAGIEESSMRALAKLQQVLPARLRPRLAAVGSVAAAVPHHDAPPVDPARLALLAAASRDSELVSFHYTGRRADPGERRVEPHHLVTVRGRWYLVAYDPERDGWRTFRVDRMEGLLATRRPFRRRPLPAADPATYLRDSFDSASYRYTARLTIGLPESEVRSRLPTRVPGELTPAGPDRCHARLSADSAELVVHYIAAIAALGAEFTLDAPEEIEHRLRALARAISPGPA
ncbi:helix-turn-helix transcriptional regulator [Prauserella oleivorans]|uniref:Helix-turn-helix transcriptional regulator n=1 Tax=Prauserella oleivorans TaxID=1478153 RepID=A0ABW5WEG2_9PSEU